MKKILAADLFCGAGGTSTGLVEACRELGMDCELTAINHWDVAIATHSKNHPDSRHLCAHLDGVDPRKLYSEGELDVLWASPECTHHSIARGGKPINDQSRATAWCVVRWAEALRPAVILVENVKEFLSWGAIGSNGRPLKSKRGEVFMSWVRCIESLGYRVDWRVLCAADYGDPTTRERLFVYAVRGRRKIIWPEPTHAAELNDDFFTPRKKWVAAREIIDWKLQGVSIFNRKKPLAEKTLNRIFIGLEKFGLKPFILGAGGPERAGQPLNVELPMRTVLTKNNSCIAEPYLVHLRNNCDAKPLDKPAPTLTSGGGHLGLVEPYLHKGGNGHQARSASSPLSTISTKARHAVCEPCLIKFYGNSDAQSIESPLGTVTTKDRFGLVMPAVEIQGERYLLDIRFRMLKPHELAAAQGFPKDYQFTGNTTQIVKQIGNAVPKNLAKALVKAALSQSSI